MCWGTLTKARVVILSLVLPAALGRALAAQVATRSDTTRPTIIFNDVFPGPQGLVLLEQGAVYRVDVEPAATITIRQNRRPGQLPLMLMALGEPSTRGISYQIVAQESAEYRIDVAANGGDVVRVRIATDPRETARWARVGAATAGQPHGGIAVRAVYLSPFPAASQNYPYDSVHTSGGVGGDLCFGVVPRGAWLSGSVGGCALNLTMVNRGADGNAIFASLAPRWMVTPAGNATQLSFVGQIGLGTSTLSHSAEYSFLGLEGLIEQSLFGSDRIGAEFQGGIWLLSVKVDTRSISASTTHLAFGLHALF